MKWGKIGRLSPYFALYFSAKAADTSSSSIPAAGIGLRVEVPPPAPPVSFQKSRPKAATLMPVIGTRQYLRHRLPGLVGQRAVDQKACQIAMTPDTHFIVDFHPEHEHVLIVGGCSGHLFKHGPVFGDFVAGVGLREWGTAERFRLGSRRSLSANESPSGR